MNVYDPNEDKARFLTDLQQIVSDLENDNIIFWGDWNLILNENLESDYYLKY